MNAIVPIKNEVILDSAASRPELKREKKRRIRRSDIGKPLDFTHVVHVAPRTFDWNDPDVKEFLQQAGVTCEQLQRPEVQAAVAKFIYTHGIERVRAEVRSPTNDAAEAVVDHTADARQVTKSTSSISSSEGTRVMKSTSSVSSDTRKDVKSTSSVFSHAKEDVTNTRPQSSSLDARKIVKSTSSASSADNDAVTPGSVKSQSSPESPVQQAHPTKSPRRLAFWLPKRKPQQTPVLNRENSSSKSDDEKSPKMVKKNKDSLKIKKKDINEENKNKIEKHAAEKSKFHGFGRIFRRKRETDEHKIPPALQTNDSSETIPKSFEFPIENSNLCEVSSYSVEEKVVATSEVVQELNESGVEFRTPRKLVRQSRLTAETSSPEQMRRKTPSEASSNGDQSQSDKSNSEAVDGPNGKKMVRSKSSEYHPDSDSDEEYIVMQEKSKVKQKREVSKSNYTTSDDESGPELIGSHLYSRIKCRSTTEKTAANYENANAVISTKSLENTSSTNSDGEKVVRIRKNHDETDNGEIETVTSEPMYANESVNNDVAPQYENYAVNTLDSYQEERYENENMEYRQSVKQYQVMRTTWSTVMSELKNRMSTDVSHDVNSSDSSDEGEISEQKHPTMEYDLTTHQINKADTAFKEIEYVDEKMKRALLLKDEIDSLCSTLKSSGEENTEDTENYMEQRLVSSVPTSADEKDTHASSPMSLDSEDDSSSQNNSDSESTISGPTSEPPSVIYETNKINSSFETDTPDSLTDTNTAQEVTVADSSVSAEVPAEQNETLENRENETEGSESSEESESESSSESSDDSETDDETKSPVQETNSDKRKSFNREQSKSSSSDNNSTDEEVQRIRNSVLYRKSLGNKKAQSSRYRKTKSYPVGKEHYHTEVKPIQTSSLVVKPISIDEADESVFASEEKIPSEVTIKPHMPLRRMLPYKAQRFSRNSPTEIKKIENDEYLAVLHANVPFIPADIHNVQLREKYHLQVNKDQRGSQAKRVSIERNASYHRAVEESEVVVTPAMQRRRTTPSTSRTPSDASRKSVPPKSILKTTLRHSLDLPVTTHRVTEL